MFVDPSWQGGGRWDNPGTYTLMYLSEAADGAVGETFQGFQRWTVDMFLHPASGHRRHLITYELPAAERVVDLDNAQVLIERSIRPSQVASKNTFVTQGIARALYDDLHASTSGIRWWSSLASEWGAYALWDWQRLETRAVSPLEVDNPAVMAAATRLGRLI